MPIYSKDIIKSRASTTRVSNQNGQQGQWVKFASAPALNDYVKSSSIILVSIIHAADETSNDAVTQYNFMISAQFSRTNAGIDTNETYIHAEPVGNWSTTNTTIF